MMAYSALQGLAPAGADLKGIRLIGVYGRLLTSGSALPIPYQDHRPDCMLVLISKTVVQRLQAVRCI